MFKNPFQVAVTFALVALILKLVLMFAGMQHDSTPYITYAYMLLILIAIFFGIRSNKVMYDGPTSFGQDFKTGARTASFFAILVGLITFIYYNNIDPEFFNIKKQDQISYYQENYNDITIDNGLKETVKSMPQDFQNKVGKIEKTFINKATEITKKNKVWESYILKKGMIITKKEAINTAIQAESIYTASFQTSYTLFGLVFLGLFHSAVFALLMKKFPGFKK